MNFDRVFAIASKDIKEVFSSISIYGPMIIVPLFFAIALPYLTVYVSYAAPALASKIAAVTSIPKGINVNSIEFMIFFSINVLGPIFLTMPIITASVIAADSFAGEKERKTSESLLSTPTKVSELVLGKIIASFLPAVFLTLVVFCVYGYITNYLAYQSFKMYILPTVPWIMMLLTAPFLTLATISVVIFVSAHVKGIKEAQQISTLLVLPILVMPFVSILGIVDLTFDFFVYLILFLSILDLIIFYISFKTFKKENIL